MSPLRTRRPRSTAILLLLLLAAAGSACVQAKVIEVADGVNEPTATTSTVVEDGGTLEPGDAAATRRGNTVAIVDAEVSPGAVHGLVEACAGSDLAGDVGVSLSFFALQLRDGTIVRPTEPSEAREPPLRTRQLQHGTCNLGWLSFDVADQDVSDVRYLVFDSQSATARWDLSDALQGR